MWDVGVMEGTLRRRGLRHASPATVRGLGPEIDSSSVAQVSFNLFESLEHLLNLLQLEYVTQFENSYAAM